MKKEDENQNYEKVVKINRVNKVVKGGPSGMKKDF